MDATELRAVQGPLKERYRADPATAQLTLRAAGRVGEGVTCSVEAGQAMVRAGLHPATGGEGADLCSGDLLLQALVACAGVTLKAVGTAMGLDLGEARLEAEGDIDFRGTLGVDRSAPVGFSAIRLAFHLPAALDAEQRAVLVRRTERYCVVLQTIRSGVEITSTAA